MNQAGGLGMFGHYGDTSKCKIQPHVWKRVVISVKNVDPKQGKGEMRTWVGTEAGVTIKDDALSLEGRFAIDASSLYIFSSSKESMMPGNIAIRTLRVENAFSTDEDVRKNQARDKVRTLATIFL